MDIFHEGNWRKIPKPVASSLGKIESWNFTSWLLWVSSITSNKNFWFKSATEGKIPKKKKNSNEHIIKLEYIFMKPIIIFQLPKDCFSTCKLRYFERSPSGLIILKWNDNIEKSTISLISPLVDFFKSLVLKAWKCQ